MTIKQNIAAVVTALAAVVSQISPAMASYTRYDAFYTDDGTLEYVYITPDAVPEYVSNTDDHKTFFWDENMTPYRNESPVTIIGSDVDNIEAGGWDMPGKVFTNNSIYSLADDCSVQINGYYSDRYELEYVSHSWYVDFDSLVLEDNDNDFLYETVWADVSVYARVEGVESNELSTKIYTDKRRIDLDMYEDADILSKDGNKIEAYEIQKGDYIAVKGEVREGRIEEFDKVEVITKTDDIKVTDADYNNQTVSCGDKSYKYKRNLGDLIEIGSSYKIYLNDVGTIVGCENTDDVRYGVILSYDAENNVVKLIDEDASVEEYACSPDDGAVLEEVTAQAIDMNSSLSVADRTYKYTLNDGCIKLMGKAELATADSYFRENISAFGNTALDENTKIIDIESLSSGIEEAYKVNVSDLTEGIIYCAAAFDCGFLDDTSPFMVILRGNRAINQRTPLAVVSSEPEYKLNTANENVVEFDVVARGETKTLSISEEDLINTISVGDVIVYSECNNKIYNLKIVNSVDSDYRNFADSAVGNGLNIGDVNWCPDESINTSFGIIASTEKGGFNLITSLNDGMADCYDYDYIGIDGDTNIVCYDYGKSDIVDERIYTAVAMPCVNKLLWTLYMNEEYESIDFNSAVSADEDIVFALVKEKDGVAQDVVLYCK